MERPIQQLSDEELLAKSEQALGWALNNYGGYYKDLSAPAAMISFAASSLVIARALKRLEALLPETPAPPSQAPDQPADQ